MPGTSSPSFKTRAGKTHNASRRARVASSALSAGQLFWQRRIKFVQRAFSLREIALEPQSFTKFSGGFRWFLCWLKIESCGSTSPFAVSAAASARQ